MAAESSASVPEETPTAWGSLFQRSTRVVRVRFLPVKDYRGKGWTAGTITEDLRKRLVEATGWATTEERGPLTQA